MLYYYAARNEDGCFVRGSLESADAASALAALRTRALFVSALDEAGTWRGVAWRLFSARRISAQSLAGFLRGFAALLGAGVPLARALPICIEGCGDKRLGETLRSLEASVAQGAPLSEAMLRHPLEFSPLVIATIRAGEFASSLDEVLSRLATALERDVGIRKKFVTALTYPAVVACAALGVTALLMTTTIPALATMYEQLRVPQPPVLHLLLYSGRILRAPGLAASLGGALLIGIFALAKFARTARGARMIDHIRMRVPIVHGISRDATMARIARLLGMLLDCGVSLHAAVPMVAAAVEKPTFRASLDRLAQALSEGSSILLPLEASGLYSPLFLQLVRVGEETGRIGEMLDRLAIYYQANVENAIQQIEALLEPAMIVVLGGIVGFVAAAIFIPLYSLIGSIK